MMLCRKMPKSFAMVAMVVCLGVAFSLASPATSALRSRALSSADTAGGGIGNDINSDYVAPKEENKDTSTANTDMSGDGGPNDDPVPFLESLLPPRMRQLGIKLMNPLNCQGDTLYPGQKLLVGQAICFNGYEFGVADNGIVTFFDHWNYHPELVIWQEPTNTRGTYLVVDESTGSLILYGEEDTEVWKMGGGGDSVKQPTATSHLDDNENAPPVHPQLTIDENGNVILWNRDGTAATAQWRICTQSDDAVLSNQ